MNADAPLFHNNNSFFFYSTDGSIWTDMLTVTKTGDGDSCQTYSLPSSLAPTVYVCMIDTSARAKEKAQDTLFVDEMFIRCE